MKYSGIYAITDELLTPDDRLFIAVEEALAAGVSMIQYRAKRRSKAQALAESRRLLALCRQYSVPLLVNDDIDLCLAVQADGVHLGQGDTDIRVARNLLGSQAIIGISCHDDIRLAQQAQEQGANYVAFGRFFPSLTKPGAPPAGLDVLTAAKKKLSVPVVAIGGINAENGAAAIAAGADMLAVIHSLFAGPQVTEQASRLVQLFRTNQNEK